MNEEEVTDDYPTKEPFVTYLEICDALSDAQTQLAQITALCDSIQPGWQQVVSLPKLRAILESRNT